MIKIICLIIILVMLLARFWPKIKTFFYYLHNYQHIFRWIISLVLVGGGIYWCFNNNFVNIINNDNKNIRYIYFLPNEFWKKIVELEAGRYKISASGKVSKPDAFGKTFPYPPEGVVWNGFPHKDELPFPVEPLGGLIGRLGEEGDPFFIGKERIVDVSTKTSLYLSFNQRSIPDNFINNKGGWDVKIKKIE